jgi:hypothetical protein
LSEQSEQSEQNPETRMSNCFPCSDIVRFPFRQTPLCSDNLEKFRGFMLRFAPDILGYAASFNAKIRRGNNPVATLSGGGMNNID